MATKVEDPEENFTQLRAKYETQRKEALASLKRLRDGFAVSTLSNASVAATTLPLIRGKQNHYKAAARKAEEVLELFKRILTACSRARWAEKLGVSDDKQQAAVNAALFNLKKQGFLTQEGRGGQYVAAQSSSRGI